MTLDDFLPKLRRLREQGSFADFFAYEHEWDYIMNLAEDYVAGEKVEMYWYTNMYGKRVMTECQAFFVNLLSYEIGKIDLISTSDSEFYIQRTEN